MTITAEIDVAAGEAPRAGEKFVIALQENSEMLGILSGGRTFRFVSPSQTERDYQKENRALSIVSFELARAGDREPRLHGLLSYQE